jgi:hypothetical protein
MINLRMMSALEIMRISAQTLRPLTVAIFTATALASCVAGIGADKLAIWTDTLAASQLDGPEILVFARGKSKLAFVGVQHDSDPASSTHRLIASTFDIFTPRVVIVEGAPTSWGYNPARLLRVSDERTDAQGLLPSGETFPAVRGAIGAGSKLLGGEPDDADVRRITSRLSVTDQDLLGFYVLRVVPQWLSQKKFDDLESSSATVLIGRQLERSRKELGLGSGILQSADAWRSWRLLKNPTANAKTVDVEEAGPLADGPWPTNAIAAAISRARDTHLYELTRQQLTTHGDVMVVYGGSHALIQYPALTALLGRPCYRGTKVEDVSGSCKARAINGSFRKPRNPE